MWLNQPQVVMRVALLVDTTEQIETFLETEALHVLFVRELPSLSPHYPLLLKPPRTLVVPVLLIAHSINRVHLSEANVVRIDFIVMKVPIIDTLKDFGSFWHIVCLVQDPLLILAVEQSEVIE